MTKKAETKTETKTPTKAPAKGKNLARALGRFPDDAVIKLLKSGNQRRPGTNAHKKYALYRTGMTVADFIAAGKKAGVRTGRSGIRTDLRRGNIALDMPRAK